MRTSLSTAFLVLVCATVSAREPLMAPTYFSADSLSQAQPTLADPQAVPPIPSPMTAADAEMVPIPAPQPIVAGPQVVLYQRVKVHHANKMHPYSSPAIIAVPDPRLGHLCCEVCVEICLPPCDLLCVKCNRLGNRITYDFGNYKVHIASVLGVVHVGYEN